MNQFQKIYQWRAIAVLLLLIGCTKSNSSPDSVASQNAGEELRYFLRLEHPSFTSYRVIVYNPDYSVRWQRDLAEGNYFPPIADKQTIYIGSGYSMNAFDIETGAVKWHAFGKGYYSNMAIGKDTLYSYRVLSSPGAIEARSAITGDLYWTLPFDGGGSGVVNAIADSNHYYFTSGGVFTSLNLSTRQPDWQRSVATSSPFTLLNGSIILTAATGASQNQNDLYLLDSKTGQIKWNRSSVEPGYGFSNNYIVCINGSLDQGLIGFDTAAPDRRITQFVKTQVTGFQLNGNQAFVIGYYQSNSPVLFSAGLQKGDTIWRHPAGFFDVSNLLLVGKTLYATASPSLGVFTTISMDAATGKTLDSGKIDAGIMVLTKSGKILY